MDLKELASKAIKGELDLTFEHHPVHSFVDGATEIQDNLLAFKGIAGFFVLDTGSGLVMLDACLLYTSPSPRDVEESRMPSSA